MKARLNEIGKVPALGRGGVAGSVPLYNVRYFDSKKNLSYIAARKKLGERATKELGVTCFG